MYIYNTVEHLFVYVMHLFTALVNCRVNIAHNQSADNADHIPPTFQTNPPPQKNPTKLNNSYKKSLAT